MSTYDSFPARLRAILERKQISQAELARRSRIDQATVSRWLSGQSEPNLAQLRRSMKALGVTCAELIDDRGSSLDEAVRVVRRSDRGGLVTWAVFRGGRHVGDWTSRSLDALGPVAIVEGQEAESLLRRARPD